MAALFTFLVASKPVYRVRPFGIGWQQKGKSL